MMPTILIVPGLWEGPESFAPLISSLEQAGFPVVATALLSTGSKWPACPSMQDDINAIHARLQDTVEAAGAKGVIVVMHSAGGFIGSSAMRGLTRRARATAGKAGGIDKLVFLAAGLAPLDSDRFGGPFMVELVRAQTGLTACTFILADDLDG
jgi:pimeloyl-ACP methyl ester carboxylesterase